MTTTLGNEDLSLLKHIYESSFPAEEQRPWAEIVNNRHIGSPRLYAIIADGRMAGLATLWILDRFAYIEHLAVDQSFRGNGVGTEAVRLLIEEAGHKPLVVEIEPPVTEKPETIARLKFYQQLGFMTIDTDYIQPPYGDGLPSVPLHLLATTTLPATSTGSTLHKYIYQQ